MKPIYQLKFSHDGENEIDLTDTIREDLLQLSITDGQGAQDDQVQLELSDVNFALALPQLDAELRVAIGWLNTGLIDMGTFKISEISGQLAPSKLNVSATGIASGSKITTPTEKTWGRKTLHQIATEVAEKHGLGARVHDSIADATFADLTQQDESDIALLARLAEQVGAAVKVRGVVLAINPKMPNDIDTNPKEILQTDCKQLRWKLQQRATYQGVRTVYWDMETGRNVPVTIGTGDLYLVPEKFATYEEARFAAIGKARNLAINEIEISLQLAMGNPLFSAGSIVNLTDFRSPIDSGMFSIAKCTHVLSNSGFVTNLELKPVASTENPPPQAPATSRPSTLPGATSLARGSDTILGDNFIGPCRPDSPFSCKVSPNYAYGDFVKYNDDLRFTTEHQINTITEIAQFLERLRERYGDIKIGSGHRSEKSNREAGGVPNSEHRFLANGTGAVDIYFADNPSNAELRTREDWIRANWRYSLGRGAESRNYTHIGKRADGLQRDWTY